MESEELRRLMCSAWPRLYLDTGDLLDIADGRADQGVVTDLITVAGDRGVILVVSLSHFQDVLVVDEQSRDRISTALERFRLRAVVMAGPAEVELGSPAVSDIVLEIAGNIRELVNASVDARNLKALAFLQQRLHQAQALNQQARAKERRPVSREASALGMQCIIALIRAWPCEDAAGVLEYWGAKGNVELECWERDTLLAQLEPMAQLMREVHEQWGLSESQRATILEGLKGTFDPNLGGGTPGQYLSGRLNGSLTLNVSRNPKPSDVVDMSHIGHLPYVDVATCDRAAFAAVVQHLSGIRGPRAVKLLRNGHLRDVIVAVSALPNAVEAVIARSLVE